MKNFIHGSLFFSRWANLQQKRQMVEKYNKMEKLKRLYENFKTWSTLKNPDVRTSHRPQ